MEAPSKSFELDFKEGKIKVQEHAVKGQPVFRILFSDNRTPLVIARATHIREHRFWTSFPEGRQQEAEEVGALISEYFKSKQ